MYKILRNFSRRGRRARVIAKVSTLEEAMAHCQSPEASSETATSSQAIARTKLHGAWFDSFTKE